MLIIVGPLGWPTVPRMAAHSPICRLPSPTVWGLQPTIGLHEHIPGHGLDRKSLMEEQSQLQLRRSHEREEDLRTHAHGRDHLERSLYYFFPIRARQPSSIPTSLRSLQRWPKAGTGSALARVYHSRWSKGISQTIPPSFVQALFEGDGARISAWQIQVQVECTGSGPTEIGDCTCAVEKDCEAHVKAKFR
jgi:hypothetical protein